MRKLMYTMCNIHSWWSYSFMIHFHFKRNVLWTMRYHSEVAWTSVANEMYSASCWVSLHNLKNHPLTQQNLFLMVILWKKIVIMHLHQWNYHNWPTIIFTCCFNQIKSHTTFHQYWYIFIIMTKYIFHTFSIMLTSSYGVNSRLELP